MRIPNLVWILATAVVIAITTLWMYTAWKDPYPVPHSEMYVEQMEGEDSFQWVQG